MAGRLGWYCAALFGWCGRAYVVHLIHRSRHRGGLPWLNRQLEQALWWCFDILGRPGHDLTQVVLTTLLDPTPPGLNYTDASSQFGLGRVLYLPATRSAYFFRVALSPGGPIAHLEVEAAAVGDAVFGPLLLREGVDREVAFVGSNVGLGWITRVCSNCDDGVDKVPAGLWANAACRGGFKWWERVSTRSNLGDRPSRGLFLECPRGWYMWGMVRLRRWDRDRDGVGSLRPVPAMCEVRG